MKTTHQTRSSDNRRFTRVIFSRTARLTLNGKTYDRQKVRNLSLGGLFLEGDYQARPGDRGELEFFEQGRHSCLILRMKVRVSRLESHGLALEFMDMPDDSYAFLQTMILYGADDPLGVSREFLESFPAHAQAGH